MRAVNLVPPDLRRAGAGGGSGSAAAAYGLLGLLALALVIVAAWAVTTRQVKDRESEVARLNAEASAAETQAANLASYKAVVDAANTRRKAVVELVDARFDWASALRDVSRVVPKGTSLTSMTATVSPSVSVEGSSTSNTLRPSVQAPAIEVVGCTPSQSDTAKLMSRLRAMKGVTKVGLASTEKTDNQNGGTSDSAAGGATGDCTAGSGERPRFNLVVFFGDGEAAATTSGTTATTGATTATDTTTSTTASTGGTK